ncbi:MAG: glycosyltransferase family A protein [Steroidobacter sp.]
MSAPLVSVIIPTYNRAALLCEAVNSVLKQTYQNIEIIVIDDGSTDDTTAAMAQYGERVRYTRRPNAGVNPARNLGLKQARGEFVALLDSDDLWAPYKLELQVRLMRNFTDVGFTFSNFHIFRGRTPESDLYLVNDGLATWFEHVPKRVDPYTSQRPYSSLKAVTLQLPREDFTLYRGDIYRASLFCPYVLPSTSLIRKSAIPAKLRFPEIDSVGDWEFFARLSKEANCLYVDLPTTYNRSHEDAVRLTRTDPSVRLGRRIALIDRLWRADKQFLTEHREEIDEVQRALLLKAAKMHLLAARRTEALAHLKRAGTMSREDSSLQEKALRTIAAVPGSGLMLFAARAALHGARQLLAR